jgi:hypothetical protein
MLEKFKLLMSSTMKFLLPMLRVLLSDTGAILMQAALKAVEEVQISMVDASGSDKRKAAFEKIVAELAVAGIKIEVSFIFAAIEAAVIKMKEKDRK